jgi:hypothetical protein
MTGLLCSPSSCLYVMGVLASEMAASAFCVCAHGVPSSPSSASAASLRIATAKASALCAGAALGVLERSNAIKWLLWPRAGTRYMD